MESESSIFRAHWFCWSLLGQRPAKRLPYRVFSIVLCLFVTIAFPVHLSVGVMRSESQHDRFKNCAIVITSIVCSVKTLTLWAKQRQIREVDDVLRQLEARIDAPEEMDDYRRRTLPAARRIMNLFYFICGGVTMTTESAVLISGIMGGQWRLMYPGYFPFDVHASTPNYVAAHLYQFVSFCVQVLQNLTSDTIGGMCLVMLSGHARLLGMRISRIGHDSQQSTARKDAELVACIKDYELLLHLYRLIEDIISWGMFVQIVAVSINMCVVIVYMMFFMQDLFSLVFHTLYLFGLPMEIFPCCYYGTDFEAEFEKLTYAIFASNWMDQTKIFKQNVRIFAEQTLKRRQMIAGNMFCVDLEIFFATLKGAYSLFAVILQFK